MRKRREDLRKDRKRLGADSLAPTDNKRNVIKCDERVLQAWLVNTEQLDEQVVILSKWLDDLEEARETCDHDENMIRLPLSIKLQAAITFLRERRLGIDQSATTLHDVMAFLNLKDIRSKLEENGSTLHRNTAMR